MLRHLELTEKMHHELIAHCAARNISFFSTGFDIESVDLLLKLGQDHFKIPSGEITNLPYLRHIGQLGQSVILSTGMATLGDIEAALAILERRWEGRTENDGLVFFSTPKKAMSDMTMSKALRAMGEDKVHVHGFRSSFTDWAAEQTETSKEVVDKALAHKLPDKVEAAYRRTNHLERRRKLMTMWADFLAGNPMGATS